MEPLLLTSRVHGRRRETRDRRIAERIDRRIDQLPGLAGLGLLRERVTLRP
ncbi:MAG: hypothetical protein ACSLFO_06060 [Acidimicrobiales bacterium]